jgi:Transaldolase/Fructose-6-phosphate aldolase
LGLLEVVVYDGGWGQGEVGQNVAGSNDFQHGQVGQRGMTDVPRVVSASREIEAPAGGNLRAHRRAVSATWDATVRTVTTDDVRQACDLFAEVYRASDGIDGRVSIEVDPRLAHDTDKSILQAIELWKIVDRPNLLIKIPATEAGLPAITAVIGEGISVNVTLIFSVERHRAVIGRLPGRAGGRQGSRPRSVEDPFGGVVLRLPGRH